MSEKNFAGTVPAISSDRLPIAIFGLGHMGELMLSKLLECKIIEKSDIIGVDAFPQARERIRDTYEIMVLDDAAEAAKRAKTLVLIIPPEAMPGLAASLNGLDLSDHLVVSLMAKASLAEQQAALPGAKIVRAVPNSMLRVGCGLIAATRCDQESAAFLDAFFSPMAELLYIEERQLPAVVTLSAGAQIYYLVDALVDAGIRAGLQSDQAQKVAYASVSGAMEMLRQTGEAPSVLMHRTLTPGGVSVEKIFTLDKYAVKAAISEAICVSAAIKVNN